MAIAARRLFDPIRSVWSRLVAATAEMVGPSVRLFRRRRHWLAVEEEDDLVFHSVSRAATKRIGAAGELNDKELARLRSSSRGRMELRLLPERVIVKTLTLPVGGRNYIEPIIEHRLERLTPWRPEKVLYGFAIPPSGRPDGTIDVRFAATSQEIADKSLQRLAEKGLQATAIGSAEQPIDKPLDVDLLRGSADVGERRLRRAISLLAILALVMSGGFFATAMFVAADAQAESAGIDASLVEVRRALFDTDGDAGRQRDLALIAGKRPGTAMFAFLDTLASIVPGDTYLTQMTIDRDSIRLAGISRNAPDLIRVLQTNDRLANPRFAAPITRDDDNRDRFEIVADFSTPVPSDQPDATMDLAR